MTKCVVDLNVVLDVLLDRAPHAEAAARFWAQVERKRIEALLAAHCLTTLHYIVARHRNRAFADECLDLTLQVFGVALLDERVVREAARQKWPDFEDAVVGLAGVAAGCSAIVTRNPRHFAKATLPVLTPEAAAEAARTALR